MRVLRTATLTVIAGAALTVGSMPAAGAAPPEAPAHRVAPADRAAAHGAAPVWPEQPRIDASAREDVTDAPTITMDYSRAPDLEPVADEAKAVMEEWYPRINDMLPTEGFQPPTEFDVIFDPDYEGVAGVAGTTMTVGATYMREHPDDLGLFVHEEVHILQQYGDNNVPGWLTEGIADYIRYYHYQADDNPIPDEERTHYTDGYGQAAFLLNYVRETYADDFVAFINDAARRDVYADQLWIDKTGKDTETLWNEAVAAG